MKTVTKVSDEQQNTLEEAFLTLFVKWAWCWRGLHGGPYGPSVDNAVLGGIIGTNSGLRGAELEKFFLKVEEEDKALTTLQDELRSWESYEFPKPYCQKVRLALIYLKNVNKLPRP